jgi:hypothetical protein
LIELWRIDGDDDVPLAEAFRFLDAAAVAGALMRICLAVGDAFPTVEQLMPELQAAAWEMMLNGAVQVEGAKGRRRVVVPPAELQRLHPDWAASSLACRLPHGDRDEFTDVRVARAPANAPANPKARDPRPTKAALRNAMLDIEKTYPPEAHPAFEDIWAELQSRLGSGVTRQLARNALKNYAPRLVGERGRRSTR